MAIPRPSGSRTRIAVLVLASITLLTIGLRDAPVVRDVREGAATVVSPVEGAADAVTRPFRNAWHGITDYEDLRDENERLRAQVTDADAGPVRATDAERQLAELSAALDLPYAADIPTVAARDRPGDERGRPQRLPRRHPGRAGDLDPAGLGRLGARPRDRPAGRHRQPLLRQRHALGIPGVEQIPCWWSGGDTRW
jgi:hypothetical protein